MSKNVVVYVRLSVSTDVSVSVERQVEACTAYAAQRGWSVVGTFVDDGVSASKNRPEDRRGWRDLMACDEPWDTVIVWKLDRLVRRISWFWETHQWLSERQRSLVSVMDNLDMSTPMGRIVAGIIAGFAEMEAEAISSRVAGARNYLLSTGRLVGGTVPFGWRGVPNPDGAGYILAQDPETIDWVRGMAERALGGDTVYSIQQWLNAAGAPLPVASQKRRKRSGWNYQSVERLLRNPVLAGLTPYNPGSGRHDKRLDGVLRDADGLPVVDESIAILTTQERARLLAALDTRTSPQARKRSDKAVTSPLLSRLIRCGHCDRFMHRGTNAARPVLSCPGCHQTISTNQLVPFLERRLLDERGNFMMLERVRPELDTSRLVDVEDALQAVALELIKDEADVAAVAAKIANLKEIRAELRKGLEVAGVQPTVTGDSVSEAWRYAESDEAKREILAGQVERAEIVRGKVGRYLDPERVRITWREFAPTNQRMMELLTS